MMVSAEGAAEVHLRGWIGDRVRAGEENGRELQRTLAACNQWFAWEGRPFAFVRDGDDVVLEARVAREDLGDEEVFFLMREFESELLNVPAEIEAHLEVVHDAQDEDCVCPPCLDRHRGAMTPQGLQVHLGRVEERAALGITWEE
jgi:hypothetical protein